MSKPSAALAKVCALAAKILREVLLVLLFFWRAWSGSRVLLLELSEATLASVDVAEEIEVIVKEV